MGNRVFPRPASSHARFDGVCVEEFDMERPVGMGVAHEHRPHDTDARASAPARIISAGVARLPRMLPRPLELDRGDPAREAVHDQVHVPRATRVRLHRARAELADVG